MQGGGRSGVKRKERGWKSRGMCLYGMCAVSVLLRKATRSSKKIDGASSLTISRSHVLAGHSFQRISSPLTMWMPTASKGGSARNFPLQRGLASAARSSGTTSPSLFAHSASSFTPQPLFRKNVILGRTLSASSEPYR
jgi:hypothetical protein